MEMGIMLHPCHLDQAHQDNTVLAKGIAGIVSLLWTKLSQVLYRLFYLIVKE